MDSDLLVMPDYKNALSTYPVTEFFRASAGQALNRAVKRGRLLKEGRFYKINPNFDDSVLSKVGLKLPDASDPKLTIAVVMTMTFSRRSLRVL